MPIWFKAKWIDPLFHAFNAAFPARGKVSDGTIGDLEHATGTSGHNPDDTAGVKAERTDADTKPEVRAADVTSVLRHPTVKMYDVVQRILATPADRNRLIYIICDGWTWRAANGWKREVYEGANKHFKHGHFSGNPSSDENGAPWTSVLSFRAGTPPSLIQEADMINPTLVRGFQPVTTTVFCCYGIMRIEIPPAILGPVAADGSLTFSQSRILQAHLPQYLGELGNDGKVFTESKPVNADAVWGVDIASLVGGGTVAPTAAQWQQFLDLVSTAVGAASKVALRELLVDSKTAELTNLNGGVLPD